MVTTSLSQTLQIADSAMVHVRDLFSFTSLSYSYAMSSRFEHALLTFSQMISQNVYPDHHIIPTILIVCAALSALEQCKQVLALLSVSRFALDSIVQSSLVRGYAMHGKAKEAIENFDLKLMSEEKLNNVGFTSVLSSCSQSGLTDEGWNCFNSMSQDHGIEPRTEHNACMVSLLSRVGKLEEAYSMIEKMAAEPDACVWGALLNSCKIHKNFELGETAAKKLFVLELTNSGNYILLSNIYASTMLPKACGMR
ncbi:E motif [Dillenia turbinata]|uniref:E motif n=1 Tax=Dillenia turbinata TaxID=194707 RepID=A0AAN8VMZ6_9MAGN